MKRGQRVDTQEARLKMVGIDVGATNPMSPPKQLLVNGEWVVPPNERPKGWENMNIVKRKAVTS